MRSLFVPIAQYGDMLLFDHLFLRTIFLNRHQVGRKAWRSGQPLPYQFRIFKKLGIRTVINLRGDAAPTTHHLERVTCKRLGMAHVDFRIASRSAPPKSEVKALSELFQKIEYPVLIHCKAGSDRSGLVSALYLHFEEGVSIADARHQLGIRFGHIRQSETGVLDYFLDRYLEHAASDPIDFLTWVEQHYDDLELNATFRANPWGNRIVDGLLRRE